MTLALDRMFDLHGAQVAVIDPAVDNLRAIAFYERLGFERVGVRDFGGDECLVMRLLRSPPDWRCRSENRLRYRTVRRPTRRTLR